MSGDAPCREGARRAAVLKPCRAADQRLVALLPPAENGPGEKARTLHHGFSIGTNPTAKKNRRPSNTQNHTHPVLGPRDSSNRGNIAGLRSGLDAGFCRKAGCRSYGLSLGYPGSACIGKLYDQSLHRHQYYPKIQPECAGLCVTELWRWRSGGILRRESAGPQGKARQAVSYRRLRRLRFKSASCTAAPLHRRLPSRERPHISANHLGRYLAAPVFPC